MLHCAYKHSSFENKKNGKKTTKTQNYKFKKKIQIKKCQQLVGVHCNVNSWRGAAANVLPCEQQQTHTNTAFLVHSHALLFACDIHM
jgi:hypothetical protein